VVVGNDYLATHARRAGARQIAHIPTVIDLTHYTVAPSPDGPFSVGWIGMPPTAKYLDQIQDALVEVCRDGDVRITLVGVTPEHVNFGGFPLETRPWSEATEVIELQRFHAGIMPLLDEPWTRGKCGYKLVQYMACGLPVVASPVGANTQIVEPGVNGLLAKTPADWVHALRTLKSSPDLRARMGQAGRAKVEAEYCLQVTAPKLLALLGSAAQGKT
jgi:glycosyltransferase involved in cell wall biosynthesis